MKTSEVLTMNKSKNSEIRLAIPTCCVDVDMISSLMIWISARNFGGVCATLFTEASASSRVTACAFVVKEELLNVNDLVTAANWSAQAFAPMDARDVTCLIRSEVPSSWSNYARGAWRCGQA